MKIHGKHYRSVWPIGEDAFGIIDQTKLPHEFATLTLRYAEAAAHASVTMQTRGAPVIGAVVSTTTRTGSPKARAKSRSRWSWAGTAMIAP